MTQLTYRYQLPKKAIKSDCPDCGPTHRRTLSRYVDTQTGEPLPEVYGRCDRQSNCGYYLSPYHTPASGLSYANQVYQQWKEQQALQTRTAPNRSRSGLTKSKSTGSVTPLNASMHNQTKPIPASAEVYAIPDELFEQSLGHYERNQLASLLQLHFGVGVAKELLDRFQIGTSSRWPGACVFWYIDEQNRKRGGQIKLFGDDWHTVKYVDQAGQKRSKTSWVHSVYAYRCDQKQQPYPAWLTAYLEKGECCPCLFGLPQLAAAPVDQPVAIVEAPKTALFCSSYVPDYVWLAVGSLAYLNRERLTSLRNRTIMLFPDASADGSAFRRWEQTAEDLRKQGFQIRMSRLLEDNASDQQRQDGADLADYLLEEWKGYPPDWDATESDGSLYMPVTPNRTHPSTALVP